MGVIFDTFPRMSFAGISFPVSRISVRGGIRKYTHEFPHSPGGEPEKLGRKLYTVRVQAHFHDLPDSGGTSDKFSQFAELYPNLYPDGLNQIRKLGEDQTTADLVIPSIGTIKAYLTEWEQVADFERARSGEEVSLDFEEDQESAFLTGDAFEFGAAGVGAKTYTMLALWGQKFGPYPSIFTLINDAVTKVQAVFGLADATNQLIAAKLEYIAQLCSTADRDLAELQHPENHLILEALKDVWSAANELAADVSQQRLPILTFTVPRVMAVGDVSTQIFGDASHAVDILDLNPIDDAFAIPAGTILRYRAAA